MIVSDHESREAMGLLNRFWQRADAIEFLEENEYLPLDQVDELLEIQESVTEEELFSFLSGRPHLLLPLGFDEFRAVPCDFDAPALPRRLVPRVDVATFDFDQETFYRRPGGAWTWFEGVTNYREGRNPISRTGAYIHTVDHPDTHEWTPLEAWGEALRVEAAAPSAGTSTILMPSLWTPRAVAARDLELTSTVSRVLQGLQTEDLSLQSIHWRDLEELVAELLRASGLRSVLSRTGTPRTRHA